MSHQPSLFDRLLTGKAARHLITDDEVRRMKKNGVLRRDGQVVYLLQKNDGPLMFWSGYGRRVKWVENYLNAGGSLKDLETTL